ncbi:hypothetical protein [Chondromyces crocatus]|uniref:Uncharacterized protein n=1 Tax=Chondromyces crocatus TaxID=52 RepID=A0A0K1EDN6_CHOCO|nr:hypothetical protein [Chondromyces crocatus]AKT38797.1 uncharacterized protein CMC5_029430 [Chondromyces crocatus]
MLNTTRLEVDRQINVGNALGPILAAPRATPLQGATRTRGDAVIASTLALLNVRDVPPRAADQATDTVVTAFHRMLEAREEMLLDTLVPLGPAQREVLGQVRLLRTRLFPKGTSFIRLPMEMELKHLTDLRQRLGEPEVDAAVTALGLEAEVLHLVTHVERYGRSLGQDAGGAGRATELASVAWHEAFVRFAAQVVVDYEGNTAMQRELLGPYEGQRLQQRAAARAARRARAAAQGSSTPPLGGSPAKGLERGLDGIEEEEALDEEPPSMTGGATPAAG